MSEMCVWSGCVDSDRAIQILVLEMSEQLGVTVSPEKLRRWLTYRFHMVGPMAHIIHDAGKFERDQKELQLKLAIEYGI